MNTESCPLERQILNAANAARVNEWTPELRAHAESCTLCSETIRLVSSMQQVALRTSNEVQLPVSYRVLWIKGQLTRREANLSKIDYIILAGSLSVAFAAIVGVVLWKWQFLQTFLTGTSAHSVPNLPVYILVGCAALVWFLTEEVFVSDR